VLVAQLTCSQVNFINNGVVANVGMVLYNLTTGLSGPITAVTSTTLIATGVAWSGGHQFRVTTLTQPEISAIEMFLDIAAGDISAALAAQNNCTCTWQPWVSEFLAKLNIIEAAAFYTCPCGGVNMSEDRKETLLNWVTLQLEKLRSGDFAICVGDTSNDYPAYGSAELAHTLWSESEIIGHYNERLP
jgi:hypothetical protein